MPHSRRSFCTLCLLAALGPVSAADVPAPDAANVRLVVQAQLDAFAADDAARAFSFADPGIRSKFTDARQFLAMVRTQYPMVHRAASISFLKPEADGAMVVQRVRLGDAHGGAWLATYLLQKQKDGQWRISACVVVPDAKRVTI